MKICLIYQLFSTSYNFFTNLKESKTKTPRTAKKNLSGKAKNAIA